MRLQYHRNNANPVQDMTYFSIPFRTRELPFGPTTPISRSGNCFQTQADVRKRRTPSRDNARRKQRWASAAGQLSRGQGSVQKRFGI